MAALRFEPVSFRWGNIIFQVTKLAKYDLKKLNKITIEPTLRMFLYPPHSYYGSKSEQIYSHNNRLYP